MDVDYVDVFYSHRFDPETPFQATMMAVDCAVRIEKVLYVGISNYDAKQTEEVSEILKK
jgi:L-glyceraldehyde 3-phosphate reductase